MSTAKRVLSGSLASWVRIGISIFTQVLLVPFYLSHWSVATYGIWLAIQALVIVLATLDRGYQNFVGYEFLRIGTNNKELLKKNLWSSIPVCAWTGAFELVLILVFVYSGSLATLLGEKIKLTADLSRQTAVVLVLQSLAWLITGNIMGLMSRALAPFGYYSRMSWWGVWNVVVTSVSPIFAVIMGADLLGAGITLAVGTLAVNVPFFIDIYRLLKKEGMVGDVQRSARLGWQNFLKSLTLSGKDFLENMRQQGIRVILAPLSGATALAAFATMRTGANMALQGLSTLTNPLMPELMRFLNQRDQGRVEASFGTVWMVLIGILAPCVLILQAVAAPLFHAWTNGKIVFDPFLFAMLSLGVLIYAQAQPAMTIMRGNNLLRPQLMISIISGIIVVGGMFVLVPPYGIKGAGVALLASEIAATQGYKLAARKWLLENGLFWPRKQSFIAGLSVWISAAGMGVMIVFEQYKGAILLIALVLLMLNIRYYWMNLPSLVLEKTRSIFAKIPVLKKAFK